MTKTFHPAKSEVMELKEIEKQIQLITGCSSLESGTIMIFIEQYSKAQYNQALDDAATLVPDQYKKGYEQGTLVYTISIPEHKQSILNLKKH